MLEALSFYRRLGFFVSPKTDQEVAEWVVKAYRRAKWSDNPSASADWRYYARVSGFLPGLDAWWHQYHPDVHLLFRRSHHRGAEADRSGAPFVVRAAPAPRDRNVHGMVGTAQSARLIQRLRGRAFQECHQSETPPTRLPKDRPRVRQPK